MLTETQTNKFVAFRSGVSTKNKNGLWSLKEWRWRCSIIKLGIIMSNPSLLSSARGYRSCHALFQSMHGIISLSHFLVYIRSTCVLLFHVTSAIICFENSRKLLATETHPISKVARSQLRIWLRSDYWMFS